MIDQQYNDMMILSQRHSISEKVLCIPLILCGLVDLPSRLEFGPISALGMMSIAYATIGLFVWIIKPQVACSLKGIRWPLILFLLFGYVSLIWNNLLFSGIQNLVVITGFICLLFLCARESSKSLWICYLIYLSIVWSTRAAMIVYALGLLRDGLGSESLIGSRTFALYALIGLSVHISAWRYGSKSSFLEAGIIVLLIGLSLSRLAFVIALALFPISKLDTTNIRKILVFVFWIGIVGILFFLAIKFIEPMQSRFFEGDLSLQIGTFGINVAGRWNFWRAIYNSYLNSPWIGNGAGTAQELIAHTYPVSAHPHNDYLRLLHDYGLLGLSMWMFAFIMLIKKTRSAQLYLEKLGSPEAQLHLMSFLALIACSLSMITDNTIVYVFVMVPLGIIVGMSLGRA